MKSPLKKRGDGAVGESGVGVDNGATSVVAPSPEERFILDYLGSAMMDSRCMYSKEMIPWIIAEILRFSASTQVVLSIKCSRLMCASLKTQSVLFSSDAIDCVHSIPVITVKAGQERKAFILILRANDIYFHCRLFAASSSQQVSEVFSTMKESIRKSDVSSSSSGGTITPRMSPISPDSLSFEVLYVGKLRMFVRKAPPTFVDEALDKFRRHEPGKAKGVGLAKANAPGLSSSLSKDICGTDVGDEQRKDADIVATRPAEICQPTVPKDVVVPSVTVCISETNSIVDACKIPKDNGEISETAAELIVKSSIPHPLEDIRYSALEKRERHPSGSTLLPVKSMSLPAEPMRTRALSTGSYPREQVLETSNRLGEYNRTMLLIVGRCEMKIISPDAKKPVFSKHFREIYQISQGVENRDHFGFICKEEDVSGTTSYVAYIFKCESISIAEELLKVLKQTSLVAQQGGSDSSASKLQTCDHCPMAWYRQLCAEVDGVRSVDRIQLVILKHIEGLCEEDKGSILQKFHGAEGQSIQEQNELLMMLLRVHCESKQGKHIHDTTENRHEFLNQFLGGGEIFTKAKRSITNSFDSFIKRKRELGQLSPSPSQGPRPPLSPLVPLGEDGSYNDNSPSSASSAADYDTPDRLGNVEASDSPLTQIRTRPRSSTIGSLSAGDKIRYEISRRTSVASPIDSGNRRKSSIESLQGSRGFSSTTQAYRQTSSPMINLFHKMGSQGGGKSSSGGGSSGSGTPQQRPGSWRHAIFKKVVSPQTPTTSAAGGGESGGPSTSIPRSRIYHHHPSSSSSFSSGAVKTLAFPHKRTKDEIRQLWKTAINQQIILIRMEKQNLRLKAKQEEADVKRLKLSYKQLGLCDEEANDTWDLIMSSYSSLSHNEKCDIQLLNSAVMRGIPQNKRGQVWQFFITQHTSTLTIIPSSSSSSSSDDLASAYPHLRLDLSYDRLLRQLTAQQHAILIDLGRTFPTHPYFSGALGSGQLALFNILKAYSLLDTDVGYCQGLSFVAGLLLMHLEEEDAFNVLKYIMFNLGARELYKPDMHELQVKLYQLTRLIHDKDPDLLLLLNHYDVLPSLYAAPWFLTLFASQFPIGFSVRVLDILLLHGVDVICKFAILLILDKKTELMKCTGLEQIMECFKMIVTNITSEKLDQHLKKVLESDWDKQMLTYSVEYSVMNDESFTAHIAETNATAAAAAVAAISPTKPASANKAVQTSGTPSPTGFEGGEKHPILGDLIQRQNSEIAKLTRGKQELRKDIQTLLQGIVTMQQLARISTNLSLAVTPEVTEVASKYLMKNGSSFAKLLEDPGSAPSTPSPSSNNGSGNSVDSRGSGTFFKVTGTNKGLTVNDDDDDDEDSPHPPPRHHHHHYNVGSPQPPSLVKDRSTSQSPSP